jgi:hypothetical protein
VSAIKHALARLDSAISKLEGAAESYESSLTGAQRDMFVAPAKPNGMKKQNGHDLDSALMARRLDQAIEKVEAILKDG